MYVEEKSMSDGREKSGGIVIPNYEKKARA
jgi:hypothetical protein